MSDRRLGDATAAELKLSHELQIAALTDPGLTNEERVRRFCKAAGVDHEGLQWCLSWLSEELGYALASPSFAVWDTGKYEMSLFANLPGCDCPVLEVNAGRADYPGIPSFVGAHWLPTRETLECFARVQQDARRVA